MSQDEASDGYALEQYRDYLRILASQQAALRFQGKVDLSGVVQDTLWEAHQQLANGAFVLSGNRLPWLRRILANNLLDAVRQARAAKRDIGREVSIQQSIEESSARMEAWLACDLPPDRAIEQEETVLQMISVLAGLPDAQREALMLHYWTDWSLAQIAEHIGTTRESVASSIKRGLRQLRLRLKEGGVSQ
jgi:RNA polymerase sigma-70 factor, ECF subfamily